MANELFISSGHSDRAGRDRGALSGKYIEGVLAAEFRKILVEEIRILGLNAVTDIDNSILSETIAFFKNKTSKDSILVDIHFNAGPSTAKGTETLIPAKFTTFELQLANKISKSIGTDLSTPLRGLTNGYAGVKTELESARKSLGWMRLTGENILIELCFISNPTEMEKYEKDKYVIAKNLARILYNAALSKRGELAISNISLHVVTKGETFSKIAGMYRITLAKLLADNNKKATDILRIGETLKIIK